MNIFDILLLAIILLGAIQGYRKGLISGLISLGGSILGLVLAGKYYPTVLQWLDQSTALRRWLEGATYKRILPSVEAKAELAQGQTLEKMLSMFPEGFREVLGGANFHGIQLYTEDALHSIALNISEILADSLLKIISFTVVYLGVLIVIEIVSAIVLAPLGLFSGTINGGGGLIVGGLVSFVGFAILVGLFSPFLSLVGSENVLELLQNSRSYPYLMQTFSILADILRFNFEQGLTFPLDLKEIPLPDPNSINL